MSMVFSTESTCPICGVKAFRYVEILYEVPYFGNVLIQSGTCRNCGYRFFDVDYADVGKPTRVIFRAMDGDDVAKSFLIRSKTGTIYSPDLGFTLEPGSHGEAFITTVEGFLYKVIDYAERLKVLQPESEEQVEQFISNVMEKIERGGFTLVVEDPLGKSLIRPYKPETIRIEHYNSTPGQ